HPDLRARLAELDGRRRLVDAAYAGPEAGAERERLSAPALGAGDHRRDLSRETCVIDHELQARIIRALEDHRPRRRGAEEPQEAGLVDVGDDPPELEAA